MCERSKGRRVLPPFQGRTVSGDGHRKGCRHRETGSGLSGSVRRGRTLDRAKYPDAEQKYRFEKIEEPKESNPLLLRFLDAETYEDKLELFQSWEAYADDQLLESIAVSLDIVLGKGSTKEKYRQVLNCLKTMEHFETNRFR